MLKLYEVVDMKLFTVHGFKRFYKSLGCMNFWGVRRCNKVPFSGPSRHWPPTLVHHLHNPHGA
jgi:hypothetical protein